MSPAPCFSLSILVPRRLLGLLAQRLADLGHPSFEERAAPGAVRVLVYADGVEALGSLQRALEGPESGPLRGSLRFEIAEVAPDWALGWTAHLAPVALTPSITLYPRRPDGALEPGALYLEPAFAFGFGEHESTRLLARWLETSCLASPGVSVLDVGCGTGVLSLVARRAGAGRVVGIDLSEPAIVAASANAALNQLEGVCFVQGGIDAVEGRFERVVANIEAGVLVALAPGIASALAASGELGLAGLIREQCEGVIQRYASLGVRLAVHEEVDGWCALVGGHAAAT
jgi:ribosomal protein L11 methyltransferase